MKKKTVEERKESRRLYRIKNAARIKETKKRYRMRNKEKISAENKKNELNHKGRFKIYYSKNKASVKNRKLKRKQENYFYLIAVCKENPCVKCGEEDFELLEFDHIDMATKKANVSDLAQSSSLKRLKEELKLCQVLCVKCHRKKTIKELGHYAFLSR